MAEYIECRECTSPNCKGCNTYTLSKMLHSGKFDCLMNENRAIHFADVAPVVRCAKCIHYEMGVCLKIYSDGAVSKYAWQERKPDDFCSYGERKDGEG